MNKLPLTYLGLPKLASIISVSFKYGRLENLNVYVYNSSIPEFSLRRLSKSSRRASHFPTYKNNSRFDLKFQTTCV